MDEFKYILFLHNIIQYYIHIKYNLFYIFNKLV
jgi:hypothetical protein